MKLLSLEIKNLGLHEDSKIEINKPLVTFYGQVKTGKSTILNAIKIGFGGSFPKEIISAEQTPAGARVSVSSRDEDFLKKEFGADSYHPAHNALRLKRGLGRKIKEWMR